MVTTWSRKSSATSNFLPSIAFCDHIIIRSMEALPDWFHSSPDARGDALGRLLVALALELGEQLVEPVFGRGGAAASAAVGADRSGGDGRRSERRQTRGSGGRWQKDSACAGNLVPRMRNVKLNFA